MGRVGWILVALASACGRFGYEEALLAGGDGGLSGTDGPPRLDAAPSPDGASIDASIGAADAPPAAPGDNCVDAIRIDTRGTVLELDTCVLDDAYLTCGPPGTPDVFIEVVGDGNLWSVALSEGFELTWIGPAATCMSGTLSCSAGSLFSAPTGNTVRMGIERTDGSCGLVTVTAD